MKRGWLIFLGGHMPDEITGGINEEIETLKAQIATLNSKNQNEINILLDSYKTDLAKTIPEITDNQRKTIGEITAEKLETILKMQLDDCLEMRTFPEKKAPKSNLSLELCDRIKLLAGFLKKDDITEKKTKLMDS